MNATSWHAVVSVKPTDAAGTSDGTFDAFVEQLLDALEDLSPVASLGDDGLQFALAVDDADAAGAASMFVGRVGSALAECGVEGWTLVHASVHEWGDFERELSRSTHPRLVGIAEIARMAGVSRQRASQLARSPSFPKPHAELASGPVWFEPHVTKIVAAWERKPGRPRGAGTNASAAASRP